MYDVGRNETRQEIIWRHQYSAHDFSSSEMPGMYTVC